MLDHVIDGVVLLHSTPWRPSGHLEDDRERGGEWSEDDNLA